MRKLLLSPIRLKSVKTIVMLTFYFLFFIGIAQTTPSNLPSVGVGLGEINYFLPYHPFTDAVKAIRWIDVATWDANGFPASANAGTTAKGRIGVSNGLTLDDGQYVLTWEGNGDVTFFNSNFTLVSEDLNSNPKRRVYDVVTTDKGVGVEINSFPATNIKLWIPGQENSTSIWNPNYVCYIDGFAGGVLRFMDFGETNNSPQQNWSDRTPKNWSTYVNRNNNSTSYSVVGAVAYEAMIELANELQSDMWICIPHLANDEYITNLAHLIKTGVDLATGQQTTQPLDSNLSVWIEYSNEVWNFNFSQSNWVNNNLPGNNLDERYAVKAVEVFNTFKNEFNADNRLIRVLATQTSSTSRARKRMNAVNRADFDVLAITTYFRYDYETYIFDNWNNGTLTHEDFYNHILNQMGSGPFLANETARGHAGTAACYSEAALLNVPVVTYEGNEHFNMVRKVDTNNDGSADTEIQTAAPGSLAWMHDFARTDFMYDLLEKYQLRHEASGLQTHIPFVAASRWSENGQWGYAEFVGQPMAEATKYRWLHDHFNIDYPVCNSTLATTDVELEQNNVQLFPNPSKGYVYLKNIPLNSKIQIVDVNGKILYKTSTENLSEFTIDISSYQIGVYFVLISNPVEGKVIAKKVFKVN